MSLATRVWMKSLWRITTLSSNGDTLWKYGFTWNYIQPWNDWFGEVSAQSCCLCLLFFMSCTINFDRLSILSFKMKMRLKDFFLAVAEIHIVRWDYQISGELIWERERSTKLGWSPSSWRFARWLLLVWLRRRRHNARQLLAAWVDDVLRSQGWWNFVYSKVVRVQQDRCVHSSRHAGKQIYWYFSAIGFLKALCIIISSI